VCGVPASTGRAGLRVEPGLFCVIEGAKAAHSHSDGVRSPGPGPTAVSGTSARMSCGICQRVSRRSGAGGCNRPKSGPGSALPGATGNQRLSAVASLDEGLEETLTLHGLGLFHPSGGEPEDHQQSGIPECAARSADRQGGSLTHVGPEPALGGQCAVLIAISRSCARSCRLRSGGRRSRRESPWHEHDIGAASAFQLKLGLTALAASLK
jgi:hypothetical protein